MRHAILCGLLLLTGCLSLPAPEPQPIKAVEGATAPAFDVKSTDESGSTSLASLTSGTNAVLVFYRGHW